MKKRLLFLICFFLLCSINDPASAENELQNRTKETFVFFPADEIKSVLDIEKEGIFVSYKDYKELYEKAKTEFLKMRREVLPPLEIKQPYIVQANYSGTIKGDILAISANYKIVNNNEKPQVMEFPLEGVLYLNATLNDKKALFYDQDGNYKIVIPNKGDYTLSIDFLVPIDFNKKKGIISFKIPKTLLGDITLVSDLFYDIRFQNVLFSSKKQIDDKMEFVGFISDKDNIAFEITNRRTSGEKRVKIVSDEKHQVNINNDLIEHTALYSLDIQNGKVNSFDLSIGKNIHIHDVSGNGISGWSRESKTDTDILHINFHVPLNGKTSFSLKTYQYNEEKTKSFEISDIQIKDLFERKGILTVYYDENIRIDTENIKFLLPLKGPSITEDTDDSWLVYKQFRILNLPYEISFSLKDVPIQTAMQQYSQMNIESSKINLNSQIVLSSLPQGTTQFVFRYPKGYILREVFASINDQPVKENHEIKGEENNLYIEVRQPVSSKDTISFSILSEQFLDEESLKNKSQTITIPAITYSQTQNMTGTLEISIDELFLLEDIILKGYMPSDMMIASSSEAKNKILYYNFRSLSPEGSILLSLRKAEQTTKSVTFLAADENLIQTNAYIQYEITAGKKDSFYFAIPKWNDSKINIEGENIKEKKKVSLDKLQKELKIPSLPDLDNYDIWNVVLQKEAKESYLLEIDYQQIIEKFNTLVDVPLVMPLDVLNDTGYIVLEASKNTEIATEKSGLNDIEAYEIPKWPSYTPSNRIVESLCYFTRPFTFKTAVTRRDESPVLASIAESENHSFTFDTDSPVFFESSYIIKNTNLQFLEIQLPSNFELWGATIQGKGIKPRKGKNNLLLIPLPVDTNENIDLRLTGQIPKTSKGSILKSLVLYSPKLNIPSLQTNVNIYFPVDYSIFNISGNYEYFPEPDYKKPMLLSLFSNLSSYFIQNFGNLTSPALYARRGLQGRLKSSSDDIGDQFSYGTMQQSRGGRQVFVDREETLSGTVQYEPYYLSTDYNIIRDESITQDDSADISRFKTSGPKQQDILQGDYQKKKGILSLNISIPKEGDSLYVDKLWGNSRLSLTFISETWKKSLMLFFTFLFVGLGFYLRKNRTMTPFSFLITTLLLCTLVPMVIMKSLIFIFNGAILGSIIFILILLIISLAKQTLNKSGFHLITILLVITGTIFSPQILRAEETKPFPLIKVYVPYKNDVPIDVNSIGNIYIPTDDYFSLKFLAQPPYVPENVFNFDNTFDIVGFKANGVLEENRIKFSGSLDIFVNTEDWVLIGLPFRNVYIEELLLDGNPIPVKTKLSSQEVASIFLQQVIAYSNKTLPPIKRDIYEIPVLGTGQHLIKLVFYVELESLPGKKTLDFGFPETLCSDLSFDIKSKDIFLEFETPENGYYIDDSGNSTVAKVSLSQRSDLRVSWFPKKYLKKEEKPLIYTNNEVNLFMGYEEIMISQQTNVRVEKSSISSLSFQMDPKLEIIDVFSDKVKNWELRKENGTTLLDITFKHEILNSADMLIKAKYNVKPDSIESVTFLNPIDAKRVIGNLNIYAHEDYKLAIENIKGLKISESKDTHLKETPEFNFQKTYSFLNDTFSADITRIPEERKFSADILNFHNLLENILTSFYSISLNIKKSSLSDIKIRIPEGLKVSSLLADGTSDYIIQDSILTLPFTRAITGAYKFDLYLEKELESFDTASIESIELLGAEKTNGTSLMLFPRGFEVKESDTAGIKQANLINIAKEFSTISLSDFGSKYAYTIKDNSFKANYKITKEQPTIDVIKVYHSIVEDNLVNVKLLNIFNIKNAPVDHFDIIAPSDLKDSINIIGDGIKTILKKEINEGKNVYITVNTVSKIDRSYMLEISFNKYFNNEKTFEMPPINFPQATNKTEYISIEASTVYHVEPQTIESLQETEADVIPVLPAGIDLNNILWSYRASGYGEWKYVLKLKRLEREKMVKAKILREDIKTLLIPNGFALHEVNIKANNRSLQFLPIYLPPEAELWSLKVAGEPSRASLAEPGTKSKYKKYLIPLIKSGAGDRSFDVTLIYITPIKAFGLFGKLNLGMIETGDISVEKTTWTLSVPDNYSYFWFKTNMDEIDLSMIEAEKTLELAREYKHWTNLASSAIGELRQQAVSNQAKVKSDYDSQVALNRSVQSGLNSRIGKKGFNQNLVQTAQVKNIEMVNEATQIMENNRPISQTAETPRKSRAKGQSIDGRRNIKGWQFKTNDFGGDKQVKESIDNYIIQEDTKQSMQMQQIERDQIMMNKQGQRYVQQDLSYDKISGINAIEPELRSQQSINYKSKANHAAKRQEMSSGKIIEPQRRRAVAKDDGLQDFDQGRTYPYAAEKAIREDSRVTRELNGYSEVPSGAPQEALDFAEEQYDGKNDSFKFETGAAGQYQEYWGAPSDRPATAPQAAVPQKTAPKPIIQKKSVLLKGLRSIDIPVPDQGRKFSFKKLGGNPRLSIYYRKKGSLSKIFLLLLCLSAGFGSLKIRRYNPPLDKIIPYLKNIKLTYFLNRIFDSRIFKILTFIIMAVSLILGSPLFAITLGFSSIFFIRFLSAKRYAKIGYVPKNNVKRFFKDLPSNIIFISLVLSFFEIRFMVFIGIATFINFVLAIIYAICTLFASKATIEPNVTKAKEIPEKEIDSLQN